MCCLICLFVQVLFLILCYFLAITFTHTRLHRRLSCFCVIFCSLGGFSIASTNCCVDRFENQFVGNCAGSEMHLE